MKRFFIVGVLMASQAFAHHGWSEYDASQPLTLTGSIEASGYEHPHGFTRLKTADKTWTVVLAPLARMEQRGLTRDMLTPAKTVTLVGYPRSDGTPEMRIERVIVDGKTIELR